jgi:glycine C-acetyltransferase
VVLGSIAAIDLVMKQPDLLQRLRDNTSYFRGKLTELGFNIREGVHPIVPIIIGDTAKAIAMSKELLDRGVYVSGFGFPVVPQGQARLRCQISAAHEREHLDRAIRAITDVAGKHGILAS